MYKFLVKFLAYYEQSDTQYICVALSKWKHMHPLLAFYYRKECKLLQAAIAGGLAVNERSITLYHNLAGNNRIIFLQRLLHHYAQRSS